MDAAQNETVWRKDKAHSSDLQSMEVVSNVRIGVSCAMLAAFLALIGAVWNTGTVTTPEVVNVSSTHETRIAVDFTQTEWGIGSASMWLSGGTATPRPLRCFCYQTAAMRK